MKYYNMKEYAIGEEFEHIGNRYRVREFNPLTGIHCPRCAFACIENEDFVWCNAKDLACDAKDRADHNSVYFEEVQ